MDFGFNSRMEGYYQKFIELQEKLRKSEEERLKLEIKFNQMVQVTKEEEQAHYRKLRSQYKIFLDEDRKRQKRNEKILRTLERVEARIDMLISKTDRFKEFRRQCQTYVERPSKDHLKGVTSQQPTELQRPFDQNTAYQNKDKFESTHLKNAFGKTQEEKIQLLGKYLDGLTFSNIEDRTDNETRQSATLRDLQKISERLHNSRFDSNRANSIAEDIMNSIYERHYKKDVDDTNSPTIRSKFTNYDRNINAVTSRRKDLSAAEDRQNDVTYWGSDYKNQVPERKASVLDHLFRERSNKSCDLIMNNDGRDQERQGGTDNNLEFSREVRSQIFDDESRNQLECNYGDLDREREMKAALASSKTYKNGNDEEKEEESEEDTKIRAPLHNEENYSVKMNQIKGIEKTYDKEIGKDIIECSDRYQNKLIAPFGNLKSFIQNDPTETIDRHEPSISDQQYDNKMHSNEDQSFDKNNVLDHKSDNPVILTAKDKDGDPIQQCERLKYLNKQPSVQHRSVVLEDEVGGNIEGYKNPVQKAGTYNQQYQEIEDRQQREEFSEPTLAKGEVSLDQGESRFEQEPPVQQLEQHIVDSRRSSITQKNYNVNYSKLYDESAMPGQGHEKPYGEMGQLNSQYEQHLDENLSIHLQQNISNGDENTLDKDNVTQPIQQYDTQYDENISSVPQFASHKDDQTLDYDNDAQKIQHYEKYDENGQSIEQLSDQKDDTRFDYDNKQYDEQYHESTQMIQSPNDYTDSKVLDSDKNTAAIQQYEPEQQYDESGQPIPHLYNESNKAATLYENSYEHGQPIQGYEQQYDENGHPIQGYNQQYDENDQLVQHHDEYGQPIIQYDEQDQSIPQYDEQCPSVLQYDQHGQPIVQYDEHGQPIVQYDDQGQPIQQYDEQGQPILQYDEQGQPILSYDEQGQPVLQYDNNGQSIQQYDETGQLIYQYDQQYDANGQPLQYDENGQTILGYDQQYDESGQPIGQYDENSQQILNYDVNRPMHQQYATDEQPVPGFGISDNKLLPGETGEATEHEEATEHHEIIVENGDNRHQDQTKHGVEETNNEASLIESTIKGDKHKEGVEGENKRTNNVLDMLDTDTDSTKHNTSKISNDSDFDFSNG